MKSSRRKFILDVGLFYSLALASKTLFAAKKILIDTDSVLIIVDVQNCFLDKGSLPVKNGEEIISVINRIAPLFRNIVITQDWHPPGHISFASSHKGMQPFDSVKTPYGNQVLWPDHCVQGTSDAEVSGALKISSAQLILRKGYHSDVDSYSAFREADLGTETGLAGYLKSRKIKSLFIAGLATDFCVAATAIDGSREGFNTYIIEDACRPIDVSGSVKRAMANMKSAGVKVTQSSDLI